MSLSTHDLFVSNPQKGSFYQTPWEYSTSLHLGEKTAKIGFRSAYIIETINLEVSQSKIDTREEITIRVIKPEGVSVSQIGGLPYYKIDMDKSSSTECVIYKMIGKEG